MTTYIKSENKNKTKKYIIFTLVLLAFSTFSGIAGDIIQSIVIASVGGGFFASAYFNKPKVLFSIPVVVIPPVASYLVTGTVESAILSLSFLPLGIAVIYGISKGLSKSQTIARGIISLVGFYAIVISMHIHALFGAVNVECVLKYIELNLDFIRSQLEAAKTIYAQTGVDVEKLFPDEMFEAAIESLRMSWLGAGIAAFGVAGFIASSIAMSNAPFRRDFLKKNGKWNFVLSKIGGVVFILAYLVGGLYSAETEGPYFLLAINGICLGLYPAVLYMGFAKIIQKLGPDRRIPVLIVLLIALSIGNFATLILLIVGVYSTLTYKEKETEKINKNK